MIITIDSNFYASPSTRLLGNYGETMSRSIAVCYPLVEGASLYKLRFLLPDLKSCYEADVTLGSMAVSGSLLAQTGKLSCQWIAAGINEQGEYTVVAKSNVFSLVVGGSIESDSAEPVPTYEQAAEMFDNAVELQQKLEGTAEQIDEFLLEFDEVKKASQDATSKVEALENAISLTLAPPIVASAQGESVTVADSSDRSLQGISVFGKSYQNGTPTPDAPVEITTTSDSESVTVTVSDGGENSQTLTIPTSIGLYGLPVTSGGNYTDSSGQQWICDEIDLARGVKVQRVYVFDCAKDSFSVSKHAQSSENFFVANVQTAACNSKSILSTHFESSSGFTKEGIYVYATGNGTRPLHFSISTARGVTTTEEAKQWLIDNGVKVLHVLKNPVEIPLTDEQKADYSALMSYFPTTTATIDNGAGLGISYIADTKTYVDNQFKMLFALISSN